MMSCRGRGLGKCFNGALSLVIVLVFVLSVILADEAFVC